MSAALHLAGPEDLTRLDPMVAACHAERGIESEAQSRDGALGPLLDGSPYGAVYLIGPRRSPVGYLVATFGWSVALGGMECLIDELFVRRAVRGRGIATEALTALVPELEGAGIRAIHLEVAPGNEGTEKRYARLGFAPREGRRLLTRIARG